MNRHKHRIACSEGCVMLPKTWRETFALAGVDADCLDIITRLVSPEGISLRPRRQHTRSIESISGPDDRGHMHWTGPGRPRVRLDGVLVPVQEYLSVELHGIRRSNLVRTCLDPECVAPDHYSRSPEPNRMDWPTENEFLRAWWLDRDPRPLPGHYNSLRSRKAGICPAGHRLRQHRSIQPSATCDECTPIFNAWKGRADEREVRWNLGRFTDEEMTALRALVASEGAVETAQDEPTFESLFEQPL